MKINKTLSITMEILLGIGELIYDSSGYKFTRRSLYQIMNNTHPDWSDTKKSIWLGKLESRNYLIKDKDGSSDSVVLTNKARIKIMENQITQREDDRLIRFVSFDIPEEKKTLRDKFRRTIKRAGFVQVQKSLWATKKNVGDIVELAAEEYKVSDYVAYIIANSTNIDQHINNQISNNEKSVKSKNDT